MPPRHLHERACHRVQTSSVEATVPPLTRAHVSLERRLEESAHSHVQEEQSAQDSGASLAWIPLLGACVRMSTWV